MIFRHAWVFFIAVTCANGAIWWSRGRPVMAEHPDLVAGYRALVRGWLVYGNLPWVVMGVGIVFGGVPSVFDYFDPRTGLSVVAFYVSVGIVWLLMAYWVFLRDGAEALVRHPGLLNLSLLDPRAVKVEVALALAGGIGGLTLIALGYVRVPHREIGAVLAALPSVKQPSSSVAYSRVFDLAEAGYRTWGFGAVGLLGILVGFLMVRYRLFVTGSRFFRRAFSWVFFGFSVIWTVVALGSTYGEYRRLAAALESGEVEVVEGKVSDFVPMPHEGHSLERFCVADRCFEYSDYTVTNGFNNTASHGGPIRPGLLVRVTHVYGVIVRLEVGTP